MPRARPPTPTLPGAELFRPAPSVRGASMALRRAIARVVTGETAYAAARAEGLALSTIYRSAAYRAWKRV